ncbi:hypothetical protein QL285_035905 [Trifolium repens]|nr:hypothetical protein QL285_035905 [Trifolium repens]
MVSLIGNIQVQYRDLRFTTLYLSQNQDKNENKVKCRKYKEAWRNFIERFNLNPKHSNLNLDLYKSSSFISKLEMASSSKRICTWNTSH